MHIERKALELFAEHGEEEDTVEQIAEAAGISVRTFFRYFPARDDVLAALPRRQNEEMARRVAARPAGESVLEAFIAGIHEPIEHDEEQFVLLWGRALLNSAAPLPGGPDLGMVPVYAAVIAERLGLAPDDLHAQVMATAIASVMWFAFLRWLEGGGRRPLGEVVEESFGVLAGLNLHTGRPQPRRA